MTYCPRDCDNTKCRRNIKSNPFECNFSYYGDFNLCEEYRKEQNYSTIAKVIEDTLNRLEVKDEN